MSYSLRVGLEVAVSFWFLIVILITSLPEIKKKIKIMIKKPED